ncbi:MAG: hypothetical protein U5K38_10665 [Woeseiaceae bacterium]|nr:hypothetical protein [Woeseiaceae bacterium]
MNEKSDKDASGNDALTQRARALFDDSVRELDGQTRSRLNKGRQQALAAARPEDPRSVPRLLPAAAAGAAALAALLVWTGFDPVEEPGGKIAATDLELLLELENLDMIEDLEFYSWIELETEAPGDV